MRATDSPCGHQASELVAVKGTVFSKNSSQVRTDFSSKLFMLLLNWFQLQIRMQRLPTGKTSRRGHLHMLTLSVNSFFHFFSIDKPPPAQCIFFYQIKACVTVLGIVLPLLQRQDSYIFISYEKQMVCSICMFLFNQ